MKSKALKSLPNRFMREECGCPSDAPHNCSKLTKALHFILSFLMEKIYYPIDSFFHRNKERIKRSWDYARFGWLNYDFDFACVYGLLDFKLRRLYKALEMGHAIQEPEDMLALRKAIKIINRLGKTRYERKYNRLHNRKWGKLEHKTIPQLDEEGKIKNYLWESWRSTTKNASDEIKEQERKEFLACYENAELDRLKDIDVLCEILKKHSDKWWD